MESRDNRTFTAGADLSTHQLKFVKGGPAAAVLCGASEVASGVLLNDPANAGAATVCVGGKVLVKAGGAIAAGALVASDANGLAVTHVAGAGKYEMGYAYEAGVNGQTIAIEFIGGGNLH